MSFLSLLGEQAHVYVREPGQERWRRVTAEPLRCRVVTLSPREAEMRLAQMRAETTHRGRCLPHPQVLAGRALVVKEERAFIITNARPVEYPRPGGHLALDLQEVPLTSIEP
jgi:hypothetical protein